MYRIGVISDTHRLLRPEAMAALEGVDHILHAGDIGWPAVIEQLNTIAPTTAIRGNVDAGDWARSYPVSAAVRLGGLDFFMIHDIKNLDINPHAAGFAAVVYGHSHIAKREVKDGVMYFNPGSAGPRRFHLPVTVGLLCLERGSISGEIIQLDV